MKFNITIALMTLSFSSSLLAAPAPWYKWRSKLTADVPCAQTSPGEGWESAGGPYKDARCEKLGLPGQ